MPGPALPVQPPAEDRTEPKKPPLPSRRPDSNRTRRRLGCETTCFLLSSALRSKCRFEVSYLIFHPRFAAGIALSNRLMAVPQEESRIKFSRVRSRSVHSHLKTDATCSRESQAGHLQFWSLSLDRWQKEVRRPAGKAPLTHRHWWKTAGNAPWKGGISGLRLRKTRLIFMNNSC